MHILPSLIITLILAEEQSYNDLLFFFFYAFMICFTSRSAWGKGLSGIFILLHNITPMKTFKQMLGKPANKHPTVRTSQDRTTPVHFPDHHRDRAHMWLHLGVTFKWTNELLKGTTIRSTVLFIIILYIYYYRSGILLGLFAHTHIDERTHTQSR